MLLCPGALGKHTAGLLLHPSRASLTPAVVTAGSARTDFDPQLKGLDKERYTVVGWDPRGYGRSRPPSRDFPPNFFERDAKDGVDLMKVCVMLQKVRNNR